MAEKHKQNINVSGLEELIAKTEENKIHIVVSGLATMAEKNTNAWKVSGKDFAERNSKEKLTCDAVNQLTRENAFNFETAIYKHASTWSGEDRKKLSAIITRVRKFGFQNLQLLDQQKIMGEELFMMNMCSEITDVEKKELENEMERTFQKQKIVSRILDTVFEELKTFLLQSFNKTNV
jgi:hypothetical protein